MNKLLRNCISEDELIDITTKVRSFLVDVAQPGSAIEMDLKFLDAVAKETKTYEAIMSASNQTLTRSFSSNGLN